MAKKHIILSESTVSQLGTIINDPLNLKYNGIDFELEVNASLSDINYIDITYDSLVSAINSSSLEAGKYYGITDYRPVYYQQYTDSNGDGTGGDEPVYDEGPSINETLVVLATSSNTISSRAISTSYPNDEIIYVYNAASNILDNKKYDHAYSGTRGVIVYRRDVRTNHSRNYDWRKIKFRRWRDAFGKYTVLRKADASMVYGPSDYIEVYAIDPLDWDSTNISDVNIKSPELGPKYDNPSQFPYGLDNFVIKQGVTAKHCEFIGFGMTIEKHPSYSTIFAHNYGSFVRNEVNLGVSSQSADKYIAYNSGIFILNSITSDFIANTVGYCYSNACSTLTYNYGTNISDNVCSNGTIEFNSGFNQISNNTTPKISQNFVLNITGNTCPSANGISNNTGLSINANQVSYITDNITDVIDSNVTDYEIVSNVCDFIKNNLNYGSINFNVANSIQNNTCNAINSNNVTTIDANSNLGAIEKNVGQYYYGNSIQGPISENLVNRIDGNLGSITEISSCVGFSCNANDNTGKITKCMFSSIYSNTNTGDINENTTQYIFENTNSGTISYNSGYRINLNSNVGSILNNESNVIYNNSNGGAISENTTITIMTNTNNGAISSNTGHVISTNSNNGAIELNNVMTISDNSNLGVIFKNNGTGITLNSNASSISLNQVSEIFSNGNSGNITYNEGYQCSNNTNTGNVEYNKVGKINANSNGGSISSNVGSVIDSNSNSGNINSNVCITISGNYSTGSVSNNNVHTISSNASDILYNVGYLIDSNTIQFIYNNMLNVVQSCSNIGTLSGCDGRSLIAVTSTPAGSDIESCTGVSLDTVVIAGSFRNHNFIDSFSNGTLTPTANISSISIATKSAFFASTGFYHEIDTSAGSFDDGTQLN